MAESLSPAHLSNIVSFQNEWVVLRECASPWRDTERLPHLLDGTDWSRLLLLAEEHSVLAHLAACLNDCNILSVPPEIRQSLAERLRTQNLLTLRLTAELFRVLELFTTQGIPALVVKGPVLAARAYGNPSVRAYGDLDLLVRQRDIRKATESMMAAGYRAAVPLHAIDDGKIPGQYLFSRCDLLVELHNDLTLRYFPRPLPIEEYFARQCCVRLDTHEVPAPSSEDELVLICIHGAKHFWERLSWIADVAGLIERQTNIDWQRASACAKAVQAEHLLHTGLRLAADVLRAKLPEPIAARVRDDAMAAKLVARVLRWLPSAGYTPPGLWERASFRLRMRGGLLTAPAYLLGLSFSPTEEDWQAGGKVSDNRFFDVVRRQLRLARKYGRSRDRTL